MVVRIYTPDDNGALDAMFKEHDADSPSIGLCSNSGVIVEEDGRIIGCSFLYLTNSPIALMDLTCVRKGLDKQQRTDVIDQIVKSMQNMGKYYGYKYIVCDPIHKKSEQRLIDHGFNKEDKQVYWYEIV